MRRTWAASILSAVLAVPATAGAAQPMAPADGRTFFSTETIKLVAARAPDESPFAFVVYVTPNPDGYFTFGPRSEETAVVEEELDLSWLAAKFGRTGTFQWATCPAAIANPSDPYSDYTVLTDLCSAKRSFIVQFRHPRLTSGDARSYSREAVRRHLRAAYDAGYGHRVRCARVSKIQQRCRVDWVVGDSVFYGTITVYRKRQSGYSGVFYRLSMRHYDEYCHLVRKRPLRECERPIRGRGQVG